MSKSDEHDETEPGLYEQPGDEPDSAQLLDHHELDDATSAGKKASEDLHGDAHANSTTAVGDDEIGGDADEEAGGEQE